MRRSNDGRELFAPWQSRVEVLCRCRVERVEVIQSLWSDYGAILRVRLEHRGAVVVKVVSPPKRATHPHGWQNDLSHQRKLKSYDVERAWYRDYSVSLPQWCRVPAFLGELAGERGSIIVLEDLDFSGFALRTHSPERTQIAACLRWLARFHAFFMGVAPAGLWEQGCYWHLETRPEELAVLEEGPLKAAASALDASLVGARFQTLVHGDAKAENFCFSATLPEAAAVDFQYVGGGCGIRDVAYFLSSCLDESELEAQSGQWLDLYFAELACQLATRMSTRDLVALEREWRSLYAVAWTDFLRFLQGWMPSHKKIHPYSLRLRDEVLLQFGLRFDAAT